MEISVFWLILFSNMQELIAMISFYVVVGLILSAGILIFIRSERYRDSIYLKDGHVVHGKIVAKIEGESVTIKTKDKHLYTYTNAQVEKVSFNDASFETAA